MNQISGRQIPWLKQSEPEPVTLRESDLDLMVLVRLIRRRFTLIVAVVVVISVLALPSIMSMTPQYRAEARFLIAPVLSVEVDEPTPGFDLFDEVERLRARSVVEKVVNQFNLQDDPEFNLNRVPPSRLSVAAAAVRNFFAGTADTAPAPTPEEELENTVRSVNNHLSAWRQTDSIMQIAFVSTDPQLAADVPNAIIKAYVEDSKIQRDARISEAISQLETRIIDQRARLDAAKADITALRASQAVLGNDRETSADLNQILLLNQQLAQVQSRRADLNATIATVDAALSEGGPAPLNETDTLIELRQSLQQQKRELARLTSQFGEAYGGVQTQRAQVAELEDSIKRELQGWADSMRVQLAHLDSEEAAIAQQRLAAQGQLSQLSVAELEMTNLIKRADTQTNLLDTSQQQLLRLKTSLSRPPLTVELLSPATVPLWAEGHGRKVYLLLVMIGAGMFGLTLAGVLELTDRTLRSQQQLDGQPGVVSVGMLPHSDGPVGKYWRVPTDPRLQLAARNVLSAIETANGGLFPGSLMITTTQPHEGAHFVAEALGQQLAAAHEPVMFVDTMPQPGPFRLGRRDGGTPGLAEFLRGEARLSDLIKKDDTTGHVHLSRGTGSLPPLYDGGQISDLIEAAGKENMSVVFICPPALESASVVQVAGAVDRVLLVMRWGKTPRNLIPLALDRLGAGRGDRIMTLINRVQPKQHARYTFRDSQAFPSRGRAEVW